MKNSSVNIASVERFIRDTYIANDLPMRLEFWDKGDIECCKYNSIADLIDGLSDPRDIKTSLFYELDGERRSVGVCWQGEGFPFSPSPTFSITKGQQKWSAWIFKEPANLDDVEYLDDYIDRDFFDLLYLPVPGNDGWEIEYSNDNCRYDPKDILPTIDQEAQITLAFGPRVAAGKGEWNNIDTTIGALIDDLYDHEEGQKDGLCFLQGEVAGNIRNSKSVIANYIICFDLDTGETGEEIDERLAELDFAYVRYTTHSHLTDSSEINRDVFFKWLGDEATSEATEDQVRRYMLERKGYRKDVLEDLKISEQAKASSEDVPILVEHAPIEKHRIIFFLNEPFVFQGKGSQADAIKAWEEHYHGFGSKLGFVYDQKTTDPARLFYAPRHAKGTDDHDTHFVDGEYVQLQNYPRLKMAKNSKGVAKLEGDKKRHKVGKTSLIPWAGKNAKYFEIQQALGEHAPDDIFRKPRPNGPGIHIECPFEDEHSKAGGQGFFIINATENKEFSEGFVAACSHDTCVGRDRLDFLKGMIENDWLPESILGDEDFYEGREDSVGDDDDAGSVIIKHNDTHSVQCKKAVGALTSAGREPILYRYGDSFARIEDDLFDETSGTKKSVKVKICNNDELKYELNEVAVYKTSTDKESPIPDSVVTHLKGMRNPPFPRLDRIVTTPIFTANGKLLQDSGYDPESCYYMNLSLDVPAVAECPLPEEVKRAVDLITDDALYDFPFNDMFGTGGVDPENGQSSRANFIALMLQPFVRKLIKGSCPGYFIDKPAPGTGAGYLADVAFIVNEGRRSDATVIARNEDEISKSIVASLITGRSLVFYDNINHKIDSGAMAMLLTQESFTGRILGKSEDITLQIQQTMIFTGNNASFSDELTRRLVPVRIDSLTARPETRSDFKHDPLHEWLHDNRSDLVWACLVLVRNWIALGQKPSGHSMASFESWARTMGGILEAAQIDGFLENLESFRNIRNEDANEDMALIELWWSEHKETRVPAKELIKLILDEDDEGLTVALPVEANTLGGMTQRLGQYLARSLVSRTFEIDGEALQVVRDPSKAGGVVHWTLKPV